MLGRLARWLRMLGFDTLYYPDIDDAALLKIARRQDRMVLTRDTHFTGFKNFKDFLLIRSNDTFEQLYEIIRYFKIKDFASSRCAKCNGVLVDVKRKADVRGLVPEHVYVGTNIFLKCLDCGNIYWEGTHTKRFRERILGVMKDI